MILTMTKYLENMLKDSFLFLLSIAKRIFESWFFWLIWPFKCLILMILTMTKYLENLLRDRTLSLLSTVNFFSFLLNNMILRIQNETFLRITRYQQMKCVNYKQPLPNVGVFSFELRRPLANILVCLLFPQLVPTT